MATDNKDQIQLDIMEEKDGSAVVDIPEDMKIEDDVTEETPVKQEKAEGGEVDKEDVDHPDDDQELRQAKRDRRRAKRDLIHKTNREKDVRLQQLQRENEEFRRQNEEVKRRLSSVEDRTRQNDVARLDKTIEDSQVRLEYAKMKLAEAVNTNDGESMVQAQELFTQAKQEIAQLQSYKHQLANAPQPRQQQQQEIVAPDPDVQRKAAEWMNRNSWYDPNNTDRDALIAKKHDEALIAEGWDPTDADYWAELDSRLQKALPHRYNGSTDSDSVVRKPRNVVGSSGREASAAYGGRNTSQFVLSPERVKAMKEAGAWDNPARKKAMVESFMKYDRQNRN
jgi:hypothetical protein